MPRFPMAFVRRRTVTGSADASGSRLAASSLPALPPPIPHHVLSPAGPFLSCPRGRSGELEDDDAPGAGA